MSHRVCPYPITRPGVTLALILALASISLAASSNEKVLYSFQGASDGYQPAGGVVFGKGGRLYGANSWGGYGGCPSPGCGTVFEVSQPSQAGGPWTETTIYAFQGVLGSVKDGLTPVGGVISDQHGNLYGTTSLGGNGPCVLLGSPTGCGLVYQLSPPTQKGTQWTETILYNFQGGSDGDFPWGDLVFDKLGNLYGATRYGGGRGTTCNQYFGGNCGTVFKLTPPKEKGGAWTEKILYSFAGGSDGADPNGGLVFDAKGRIFGTTYFGGSETQICQEGSGGTGCGTVFRLDPPGKQPRAWNERLLYLFNPSENKPDAANPGAGVIFGRSGDLYGTTVGGGNNGWGAVFELERPSGKSDSWTEEVLHLFNNKADGRTPWGAVVFDESGSLYGTASAGSEIYGDVFGTVYEMTPPAKGGTNWNFKVLHSFEGSPDGEAPAANLIFDKAGSLYSTTQYGGTGTECGPGNCGTVFEVSAP